MDNQFSKSKHFADDMLNDITDIFINLTYDITDILYVIFHVILMGK